MNNNLINNHNKTITLPLTEYTRIEKHIEELEDFKQNATSEDNVVIQPIPYFMYEVDETSVVGTGIPINNKRNDERFIINKNGLSAEQFSAYECSVNQANLAATELEMTKEQLENEITAYSNLYKVLDDAKLAHNINVAKNPNEFVDHNDGYLCTYKGMAKIKEIKDDVKFYQYTSLILLVILIGSLFI